MGHGKGKSCSSPEAASSPPPVVHDLVVTGCIIPNINGYYDYVGIHNGKPYYARYESVTGLLWNQGAQWALTSPQNFTTGPDYFTKEGENPQGSFQCEGDADGLPIVTDA